MSAPGPYYVFGTHPKDNTPQEFNFFGASGWWSVPLNWYVTTDANGVIWASPNADFSTPKYLCHTNGDEGTLVFQDVMRSKMAGLLSSS